MAHGHFIDVGKTVSNRKLYALMVFDDTVPFAADIAGRLGYLTE